MQKTAILVLNAAAMPVARQIAGQMARCECEIAGLRGRVDMAPFLFSDFTAEVQYRFRLGQKLIGICAAETLIRAVAPMLAASQDEPPVLAVSQDGQLVVPLLGEKNGANELALEVAGWLKGKPAITASGFRHFGVVLEAPPEGYWPANPEAAPKVMARLLDGGRVALSGSAPWLQNSDLPIDNHAGDVIIKVTPFKAALSSDDRDVLVYHPQSVIAAAKTPEKLTSAALADALQTANIADAALAGLLLPPETVVLPQHREIALNRNIPLRVLARGALNKEGLAALAAQAGIAKCEVVEAGGFWFLIAPDPVDMARIGVGVGQLSLVGLGPAGKSWLLPQARDVLAAATDLIGDQDHLDRVPQLRAGQRRHPFSNRDPFDLARQALDLAVQGRQVALVSAGDPGFFGIAAAAMEALEQQPKASATVEIEVLPGLSAIQAVAAQAGAPLGHDFCVIALSDLLTTEAVIEKRLLHAAQGDFVTVLYSTKSQSQRQQIEAARAILRSYRRADTPVVVADDIGEKEPFVTMTTLSSLKPSHIGKQSLMIIGSSQTRMLTLMDGRQRIYTPRSYGI